MVCGIDTNTQAVCCVLDTSRSEDHVAFLYPITSTVGDLFEEVGRRFSYHPDTFELTVCIRGPDSLNEVSVKLDASRK